MGFSSPNPSRCCLALLLNFIVRDQGFCASFRPPAAGHAVSVRLTLHLSPGPVTGTPGIRSENVSVEKASIWLGEQMRRARMGDPARGHLEVPVSHRGKRSGPKRSEMQKQADGKPAGGLYPGPRLGVQTRRRGVSQRSEPPIRGKGQRI